MGTGVDFFFFEIQSHYVAQTGFELVILLSQSSKQILKRLKTVFGSGHRLLWGPMG
jgi:hypothetical protein